MLGTPAPKHHQQFVQSLGAQAVVDRVEIAPF
jgi:hypothetical protein